MDGTHQQQHGAVKMNEMVGYSEWVVVNHYCSLFLLRGSSGSSSSARSAVSAGLSSECTFEAMLERRVGGPGVSKPLNGKRAPGSVQPLSGFSDDEGPSGGVPCLDVRPRDARGSWYDSKAFLSCSSPPPIGALCGEEGHCVELWPDAYGE